MSNSATAPDQLAPTVAASTWFSGLDGLRAIAVVAVMIYHLSPGALVGGYLGVDIFFVISGFLITALLIREKEKSGSIHLGRFWVRRARRLLPALALVVLACSAVAWAVGGDVLVGLGRQLAGAATFSSNWVSLGASQSYFTATTPELFRNLWSLAVEEQFYLLWPLVVMGLALISRRSIRATIVAAFAVASAAAMIVLSPGVLAGGSDATRVYYGTDTHSFGLALGACLAILTVGLPAPRRALRALFSIAGSVAIVGLVAAAAFMRADAPFTYQGGLAIVAVLSTIAVLGATTEGSWLGRGLDVQPLRWVGQRSYGLYLWHWPVFVLVAAALPTTARESGAAWVSGLLALAITVVCAALSYRFVEQPVRRLGLRGAALEGWRRSFGGTVTSGRRVRVARIATGAAVLVVTTLVTAGTVAGVASDPGTGSAQKRIEAGQRALDAAKEPLGTPSETTAEAAPALPGGEQISAIGDSVMLASAAELQTAFPGIDIDASVSRQFSSAPDMLQARKDAGTLRPVVLLGLGTNGPIDSENLAAVRQMLGNDHQIVLVNVYAPRHWTEGVNVALSTFAQKYRDVELANWRDSIAPQVKLLARDQIHPGDAGGRVYAAAVRDALQRLADLPPLIGPRDYGLAPLPI
jgi:peptidoglycan/LPS O-acetylase OafA/YrhL